MTNILHNLHHCILLLLLPLISPGNVVKLTVFKRGPQSLPSILLYNVAPSDNGRNSIWNEGMMFRVSSCVMRPRHRETAGCPSGTQDGTDPFRVDGRWVSGELDQVLQYQPCAFRG